MHNKWSSGLKILIYDQIGHGFERFELNDIKQILTNFDPPPIIVMFFLIKAKYYCHKTLAPSTLRQGRHLWTTLNQSQLKNRELRNGEQQELKKLILLKHRFRD